MITKLKYRKQREVSLIYAQVQPELKLKLLMYEAAYSVSAIKKSNVYDDVVFLTEKSRLLKSIHPLDAVVCRNNWQKNKFAIPGFGDRTFKVNRAVTETFLRQASKTTYVVEPSQSFMVTIGREGAMYAEPVEWVFPTGEKLIGYVAINAKI